MPKNKDIRPFGERNTPTRPSELPTPGSNLDPLPFFPNLKIPLRSVTACLVLTYLEIHHPAPQDSTTPPGRPISAPVRLDLDHVCQDLQLSRRTLHIAFRVLGVFWVSEEARSRAARAGREFVNDAHTQNGKLKPYSFVGQKGWRPHQFATLRRNMPRLNEMLALAGITDINQEPAQMQTHNNAYCESQQNQQFTSILPDKLATDRGNSTLLELLERVSPLARDRREERWDRWRKSRKAGLVEGIKQLNLSKKKSVRSPEGD